MEKTAQHDRIICFGEILWDVLPTGAQPGGAPLNVAYHLNKLGVPASLISRVGTDNNGVKLEQLMNDWNIPISLLQKDPAHDTSEVLTRMNNGNEVTYEIVFPVAWDFISATEAAKTAAGNADYFVYGSLASRNDITRNALLQLLNTGATKVFDINLRPPFMNRGLLESLFLKADIVKFNEAELDVVQTMFRGTYTREAGKVAFISERFGIPEIIVTKGEFGAAYYKAGKAYHAWSHEVKVSDTIGSGDSFLAAFLDSHAKGLDPQETLLNAVAMGSFIATQKGGCPHYDISDYLNFRNQLFKP